MQALRSIEFNESKVSSVYKKLRTGPMKSLLKYLTPNTISFAGGIPLEKCFPFESVTVQVPNSILYRSVTDNFTLTLGKDLALNYTRGNGMASLSSWIKNHVKSMHNPPYNFDISTSVGSSDSWSKILTLLGGDSVIFDQYIYGPSVMLCETYGKTAIGVKSDDIGMIPDRLQETVLKAREQGYDANILYLVPVGHNPTGVSMTYERKEEVYKICQELDIIIVEDDSYYYVNMEKINDELPGIKALPRSFVSMDVDGRVLRMDSVSKFISPGVRLGWVTAPPDFAMQYQILQEYSVQFPSGFSQSIIMGLINHWGEEGFHKHVQQVQSHYLSQRNCLLKYLKEYFKEKDCYYVIPTAGMFIWLEFRNIKLTSRELFEIFAKADILTVPGDSFYVSSLDEVLAKKTHETTKENGIKIDKSLDSNFYPRLRLTYAASSEEQMRVGMKRMSECFYNHFKN